MIIIWIEIKYKIKKVWSCKVLKYIKGFVVRWKVIKYKIDIALYLSFLLLGLVIEYSY